MHPARLRPRPEDVDLPRALGPAERRRLSDIGATVTIEIARQQVLHAERAGDGGRLEREVPRIPKDGQLIGNSGSGYHIHMPVAVEVGGRYHRLDRVGRAYGQSL